MQERQAKVKETEKKAEAKVEEADKRAATFQREAEISNGLFQACLLSECHLWAFPSPRRSLKVTIKLLSAGRANESRKDEARERVPYKGKVMFDSL